MIRDFRQPGDLFPEIEGVVVFRIDRRHQTLLVETELLGDQIPGKLNGKRLEIVAKGEVAEHLEEGVVPGSVADIVEVVVLAAGAHTFLRSHGAAVWALFQPREDVLELHHPRIGEHQGRIIARDERRGRHDLMAMALEVIEKSRSNFVNADHDGYLGLKPTAARAEYAAHSSSGAVSAAPETTVAELGPRLV